MSEPKRVSGPELCPICGELSSQYGCSPRVAVDGPWLCRNTKREEVLRFAEAFADLVTIMQWRAHVEAVNGPEPERAK